MCELGAQCANIFETFCGKGGPGVVIRALFPCRGKVQVRKVLPMSFEESERNISTLETELEKTRDSLASVEKAHNAAEIKLNMQNSHQKRLDQELAALKARPKLDQALAELEERNNEMEELLKKKCAEIEQNDDRVIE